MTDHYDIPTSSQIERNSRFGKLELKPATVLRYSCKDGRLLRASEPDDVLKAGQVPVPSRRDDVHEEEDQGVFTVVKQFDHGESVEVRLRYLYAGEEFGAIGRAARRTMQDVGRGLSAEQCLIVAKRQAFERLRAFIINRNKEAERCT